MIEDQLFLFWCYISKNKNEYIEYRWGYPFDFIINVVDHCHTNTVDTTKFVVGSFMSLFVD